MPLFRKKTKIPTPPTTDSEWEDYLSKLPKENIGQAASLFDDMNVRIGQSIKILEDTQAIGVSTLNKLDEQGEQLKKIDDGINEIRRHNYDNRRRLRSIRSIFGSIWNKLTSCSCLKPQNNEWEEPSPKQPNGSVPNPTFDPATSTTDHTTDTPLFDRYKETERGLGRVKELTGKLETIAEQMNDILLNQNSNLDRMLSNADKAYAEMRANTETANSALQ